MALTSAQRAGVNVPAAVFDIGRAWLGLVSDERRPGLYTYRPGCVSSPAMTAESMFVHRLLATDPADAHMRNASPYLLEHRPTLDRGESSSYWYYGTLEMLQVGSEDWERWNNDLKNVHLRTQRVDGVDAGSWDPSDKSSVEGGRVYQTAICTLTLEVDYRYLPLNLSEPKS